MSERGAIESTRAAAGAAGGPGEKSPPTGPVAWARRLWRLATGAAAIYLVAAVLARAAGFVLIPLYTRRLSREEYGDYALAQTVIVILPMLLSLGLASAVSRFYFDGADREAARRRAGGAANWFVLLTVGSTAILQVALLLVWPAGVNGLAGRWELSCILWAGAGSAIGNVPALYLRAAQRPLPAAAFQFGQFVFTVVAGLVLVAGFGRGLRGSIEALAIAGAATGLLGLGFILFVLRGGLERTLLVEAVRFSLPFVPHFAAQQLQQVSDRWTMKALGLDAALGEYALAGQIVSPTYLVVGAVNDAVSPQMGELCRDGPLHDLRVRFSGFVKTFLWSAILPGAGITACMPLVALVVGGHFVAALYWVPPLLVVSVIEVLYYPCANVLFFANRTTAIPLITITTGLLNLGLNVVLLRAIGLPGAVIARFVSLALRSAATWFAARRCFRTDTVRDR